MKTALFQHVNDVEINEGTWERINRDNILYSHYQNILNYIEKNNDETDSTYHIYTLISDYFYYLDKDLWKLFKTIKFDVRILHDILHYSEEDLEKEGEEKDELVCDIVNSILSGCL